MNILLILAIFWPALAGLVIFLTPGCKENKQLRGRAVNAALAVELALTLAMCMGQGTKMVLLNMTQTLRIEMNVDMTGCIFAVLMSTMWLLSSVFAREYMGHDGHERLYQVFFMCVLSALIGQCYAGSMVTLYVFYELMTLLSVPMVVHERTPQAVAAGIKYLVYSIFGAMLGLLGIFFFSNYLGTVTFVPGGVETAASAPSGPCWSRLNSPASTMYAVAPTMPNWMNSRTQARTRSVRLRDEAGAAPRGWPQMGEGPGSLRAWKKARNWAATG